MRFSFCVLLLFFTFNIKSQNLVPNPSFEQHIICPYQQDMFAYVTGWSSYGGTPDYFNTCVPPCSIPQSCVGIPSNFFGYQTAFAGNAYAGIVTSQYGCPSCHEFILTQLISTLVPGKKYNVSMYVSRGNGINSHGATNNLGFRFFTTPTLVYQVQNFANINDTAIVTDSVNWTKISGSILADSTYNYLEIGNFYEDRFTDTLDLSPPLPLIETVAYYFIDSVSVTEDLLWTGESKTVAQKPTEIYVFPNPVSDILNIENIDKDQNIFIKNLIGENIIICKVSVNSIQININELKSGIYFVNSGTENKMFVKQ